MRVRPVAASEHFGKPQGPVQGTAPSTRYQERANDVAPHPRARSDDSGSSRHTGLGPLNSATGRYANANVVNAGVLNAMEDGAIVNFVRVDNLLKYELSLANAQKHGLVVGLTLKNLAHRVEE